MLTWANSIGSEPLLCTVSGCLSHDVAHLILQQFYHVNYINILASVILYRQSFRTFPVDPLMLPHYRYKADTLICAEDRHANLHAQIKSQLAFYINLQRAVSGPSATLTGR